MWTDRLVVLWESAFFVPPFSFADWAGCKTPLGTEFCDSAMMESMCCCWSCEGAAAVLDKERDWTGSLAIDAQIYV